MRTLEIVGGSDEAQKHLENGGSKVGAMRFLDDVGLGDYLPEESHVIEPGDSLKKVLKRLDNRTQYIVRLGHPADVTGLVDVLPTDHGNGNGLWHDEIEDALLHQRGVVACDVVRSYMRYELGRVLEPDDLHCLIQSYHGPYGGSILENPRGVYRVEYRRPEQLSDAGAEEFIFNEEGDPLDIRAIKETIREAKKMPDIEDLTGITATMHAYDLRDKAGRIINEALSLYRKVKKSRLFPDDMSFQMEYGVDRMNHDRILFYQARLFGRFQEVLAYHLGKEEKGICIMAQPFSVYGTTDRGGIVCKVGDLDEKDVASYASEERMGYVGSGHRGRSAGLDVHPRNIAVYHPMEAELLGHHHYRWMQKADVTLPQAMNVLLGPQLGRDDKILSWSNGIVGGVRQVP